MKQIFIVVLTVIATVGCSSEPQYPGPFEYHAGIRDNLFKTAAVRGYLDGQNKILKRCKRLWDNKNKYPSKKLAQEINRIKQTISFPDVSATVIAGMTGGLVSVYELKQYHEEAIDYCVDVVEAVEG